MSTSGRLAALTATACVIALSGCHAPPLSLEQKGKALIIHAETLSEYPTSVDRITVKRKLDGSVVFEAMPKTTGQIGRLTFLPGLNGPNSLTVDQGEYDFHTPRGSQVFLLEAGVTYVAALCDRGSCSRIDFMLQP